jgi:uncharacterized membrane protein
VRVARLAFAGLATLWLVLLATAPTAAFGVPASALAYAFGSVICHQRPDRSFHVGVAQLPVCARCYGLYLGAAIGAIAALMSSARADSTFGRLKIDRRHLRLSVLLAAVPTAVTWLAEVGGLWSPSNVTRFVAALPLGAAVAVTVNYVECARPPRSESRRPPTPI